MPCPNTWRRSRCVLRRQPKSSQYFSNIFSVSAIQPLPRENSVCASIWSIAMRPISSVPLKDSRWLWNSSPSSEASKATGCIERQPSLPPGAFG